MISRPLFIIVAESIVIFGPIFQVGCASASSTVIASKRRERPAAGTGPPEAVSTSRRDLGRRPAAQRLVDRAVLGVHRDDLRAARLRGREDRAPRATTSVSLFASASRLPAAAAAYAERRPSAPTRPPTTTSASGCDAASSRPAVARRRSGAARPAGRSACELLHVLGAARPTRAPAGAATTCSRERLDRAPGRERHDPEPVRKRPATTSSAERPIDPVEPSTESVFMVNRRLYRSMPRGAPPAGERRGEGRSRTLILPTNAARTGPANSSESIRS